MTTTKNTQEEKVDVSTLKPGDTYPDTGLKILPADWIKEIEKEMPEDSHELVGNRQEVYISITNTLLRLNEVFGPNWSTENETINIVQTKVPIDIKPSKYDKGDGLEILKKAATNAITQDNTTAPMMDTLEVVVKLQIVIRNHFGQVITTRLGLGAANYNPAAGGQEFDDKVKTAQAMAVRKAANSLGLGLYLWDANRVSYIKDQVSKEGTSKTNYRGEKITPKFVATEQLKLMVKKLNAKLSDEEKNTANKRIGEIIGNNSMDNDAKIVAIEDYIKQCMSEKESK